VSSEEKGVIEQRDEAIAMAVSFGDLAASRLGKIRALRHARAKLGRENADLRTERDRYRQALDGIANSRPIGNETSEQHRDRLQSWAQEALNTRDTEG
jgi:hypothetical protein